MPSVSRREELLSMLIALKQDNKQIAEFLAIAPRSVLMLVTVSCSVPPFLMQFSMNYSRFLLLYHSMNQINPVIVQMPPITYEIPCGRDMPSGAIQM